VLPAISQIVSVLAIPQSAEETGTSSSPKSAFAYFMTATGVSGICLLLFLVLLRRHSIDIGSKSQATSVFPSDLEDEDEEEAVFRKSVPLLDLWRKLKIPAIAIFLNFCFTMVFPVFTQAITSVHSDDSGRAFQPDVFIPTAFLLWNVGDLSGRIICGWEKVIVRKPSWLAILAVGRLVFIPLYFMCNINGQGALIRSDLFYMLVQLGFGFTSGWIGSSCMIVAPDHVNEDEKEACGGFMGLCLVLGLTAGSMLSFLVLN